MIKLVTITVTERKIRLKTDKYAFTRKANKNLDFKVKIRGFCQISNVINAVVESWTEVFRFNSLKIWTTCGVWVLLQIDVVG